MLQLQGITKNFRDYRVLDQVRLEARPGEIYGLVGSNGCGKTTLLKHIMQIYTPDSGQMEYGGKPLLRDDRAYSDFYYVQDDLFFPYGSTLGTLFQYESMLYPSMSAEKFRKLTEYFQIDRDKKLSQMSKGQKKQAAFVLAMSAGPKVLLLDEIVDGLDAVVRRKFWNVLLQEVSEQEMIVIISSHDLKELDNISDRVGIMHQGRIIREETMEGLKENLKRLQFAVAGTYQPQEPDAGDGYRILKTLQIGSVYFVTLEGDVQAFENRLRANHQVLLCNEIAMNLEEIFITELGGSGYGTEELAGR